MEVDLPQGKKACHCGASCGISKMSCGQVLVSPVTQQQGLARQRYNNLLSSGRLLGPSRAACDLKDCLMAFSVRRVMCPQCLGQVQRGGAMWCAHMGPKRKPSALQAGTHPIGSRAPTGLLRLGCQYVLYTSVPTALSTGHHHRWCIS